LHQVIGIHLKRNFVAVKAPFKYHEKLKLAQDAKVLRVLPDYATCELDFVSNDYLGMSRVSFPERKVHSFAGLGSRLIAGNSSEASHCEDFLAELFSAQAALVFNSGYDANLGFFSTVPQKDEVVFYDQAIHASIRDGLRLSAASNYAFAHNDLSDLELKLARYSANNKFIVVEGVYSMDGDEAPIQEILSLAQRFDAQVIVDEAHSLGVLGDQGLGLSLAHAHHPNLLARILTFGKAVGAHGAAVVANREIKAYLVHACRTFIYTTAMPPESYTRIEHCLAYLQNNPTLRLDLKANIQHFANVFKAPQQHIQTVPVSGIAQISALMQQAKSERIALKGVWSPTVAEGQERLRISLHNFNTEQEINMLHQFITQYV